jgi:hypothetical protein
VSDDITPATVMAGFWRWFGVGVLALALLAALIVGGWRAGWWFAVQNNSRQAHMIQNGYANQSGLLAALNTDLNTIESITVQMDSASGQQLADLTAQRAGVAKDACTKASEITVSLGGDQGWVARNCSGGSLAITSPLAR